jgi:hypothetical protein
MKKTKQILLTKTQHKKIIDMILRVCELQYRKGFQQGYEAANRKELSEEKVATWRLNGYVQNFKKAESPFNKKIKFDPKERVKCERLGEELLFFMENCNQ